MNELITFIGGTTIALSVVAWLIRSLTAHLLNKDIDLYKSTLQLSRELELEQFTFINQERANVIVKLYGLLQDYYFAAEKYLDWNTPPPAEIDDVAYNVFDKAYEEYTSFFRKNDIYFSKELCSKIDALDKEIFMQAGDLILYRTGMDSPDYDPVEDGELRVKLWLALREKAPPVRETIKEEFRKLHGVHIDPDKVEEKAQALSIQSIVRGAPSNLP